MSQPTTEPTISSNVYARLEAAAEIADARLEAAGSHWDSIWMVLYRDEAADNLAALEAANQPLPTATALGTSLFNEYLAAAN